MIDWDRVNELREEVGIEDFQEVADLFLEEVDEVIERLKSTNGTISLEEEMHFLKGSALNLGFTLMGQVCQQGEKAASGGRKEEVDLPRLFKAYEDSKVEFLANQT
ncbi:Hpt domain-containing protein [Falsihalocynthiibacter arcticus]|uniref:Histidine kinase n=1 Tax=Falsihalocynthiibacter arcticus TaxID=1579316 RepID=A0A126UXV4_9RHOB|nr:Hpt domain-containing protein [Falsihalocynthiibacter arcticus]AML50884.1 histidine kinase [Falsihalocynthiibacter arcticus]